MSCNMLYRLIRGSWSIGLIDPRVDSQSRIRTKLKRISSICCQGTAKLLAAHSPFGIQVRPLYAHPQLNRGSPASRDRMVSSMVCTTFGRPLDAVGIKLAHTPSPLCLYQVCLVGSQSNSLGGPSPSTKPYGEQDLERCLASPSLTSSVRKFIDYRLLYRISVPRSVLSLRQSFELVTVTKVVFRERLRLRPYNTLS